MRTILHYLAAIILLTIYGGQVCPLIDTLTITKWGTIVLVTFMALILVRNRLQPRIVGAAPLYDQPGKQFRLEFFLFVGFSFVLSDRKSVV